MPRNGHDRCNCSYVIVCTTGIHTKDAYKNIWKTKKETRKSVRNFPTFHWVDCQTWVTKCRLTHNDQWRNRQGAGGAECPPPRPLTGIILLTYREKRGKEKGKRGKNWEEKKKDCEREGGKLELEVGKLIKRGEDLFFFFFFFSFFFFFFFFFLFFFFFFFFCFFLFTFENDGNLVWVYQNQNFLLGKSISRREKFFAPSEKYACYAPDNDHVYVITFSFLEVPRSCGQRRSWNNCARCTILGKSKHFMHLWLSDRLGDPVRTKLEWSVKSTK